MTKHNFIWYAFLFQFPVLQVLLASLGESLTGKGDNKVFTDPSLSGKGETCFRSDGRYPKTKIKAFPDSCSVV